MTDILARAAEMDPSQPIALAALVREGDPAGVADFTAFAASYRQMAQDTLGTTGGGTTEISGDEVHENLINSVLPRLVDAEIGRAHV